MIFFNNPEFSKKEIDNLKFLTKTKNLGSNGYFTKNCSNWIKNNLKCREALMVHSCTAALEMTAILINIKKYDEVIMPSYTFVSTANAFVMRGATPVFVDVNYDDANINFEEIKKSISKKTKAVVVVHYAGIACEIEKIKKLCNQKKIFLIEDAAHSILSKKKNKFLGTFGDFGTLSFHETKNVHCGHGGALIINNKKYIKLARIIKDKGTDRHAFDHKKIKKYSWKSLGSSFAISEVNAAILYAQLKKAKSIIKKRIKIWNYYYKKLRKKNYNNYDIPTIKKNIFHNGHMFYILCKKNSRNQLRTFLKKFNIETHFHYLPLESTVGGKKFGKILKKNNKSFLISKNILRLPFHNKITKKQIEFISAKILEFYKY